VFDNQSPEQVAAAVVAARERVRGRRMVLRDGIMRLDCTEYGDSQKVETIREVLMWELLDLYSPYDAKELGRAQLPCARSRKCFLLDW
jgi:hypothetical protein